MSLGLVVVSPGTVVRVVGLGVSPELLELSPELIDVSIRKTRALGSVVIAIGIDKRGLVHGRAQRCRQDPWKVPQPVVETWSKAVCVSLTTAAMAVCRPLGLPRRLGEH